MKFAKKIVLVPSERYEQMQMLLEKKKQEREEGEEGETRGSEQQGAGHLGSGYSHAMQSISTPSTPYVNTGDSTPNTVLKPRDTSQDTLEDIRIVDSVGKKFKNKAANLLAYVRSVSPDELTWNNRGEIVYNDKVITGSNIIDLFRSLMHNTANVPDIPGVEAFENVLHNLNVPITLIANNSWKKKLRGLKTPHPTMHVDTSIVKGKKSATIVKKRAKIPKKNATKWLSL